MANHGLSYDTELACCDCGALGAFAFDGADLCAECYQARGSSCGGGAASAAELGAQSVEHGVESQMLVDKANASIPLQTEPDRHRLNPNCCYQADATWSRET